MLYGENLGGEGSDAQKLTSQLAEVTANPGNVQNTRDEHLHHVSCPL